MTNFLGTLYFYLSTLVHWIDHPDVLATLVAVIVPVVINIKAIRSPDDQWKKRAWVYFWMTAAWIALTMTPGPISLQVMVSSIIMTWTIFKAIDILMMAIITGTLVASLALGPVKESSD